MWHLRHPGAHSLGKLRVTPDSARLAAHFLFPKRRVANTL